MFSLLLLRRKIILATMTMLSLSAAAIRVALFAAILSLLAALPSRAQALLQPNDRLAFCGDSMTGGAYTRYIEDYLVATQSIPGIDIRQFGWFAENPDQFLAGLDKNLLPYQPTVATILFNFGDNGGKPLDPAATEARREGETKLIDALKKTGVRSIVLGSPSCVDATLYHKDAAQAKARNDLLAAVAAVDKDVAAKEGVAYADVYGATMDAMTKAKAKFGPDFVFDGENDFVSIAYAFLKALGVDGNLGTITVAFTPDFAIGKAEAAGGPAVLSFANQTLTAQSTRYTFCFPGHPTSDPLPKPFMSCLPLNTELNRLQLVVKNLPTPLAKIYWNDKSHDYTADELAKGVPLPASLPAPWNGNCENLDRQVGDQQEKEATAGRAAAAGTPNVAAAQVAATGLARAQACRKPVTYTIRIQPLAAAEKQLAGPVNIIFDTDMNSDCDDAGALALLNDFMCLGECKIIACNVNTHDVAKSSGAVVQAINAYYGHPDIPIGACYDTNEPQCGSTYTALIHKRFDPDFPNDDRLPKGVDVYRKALAAAPDNSVVICSVGWMENITDLLKSGPDAASPLAGPDLVKQKVRKLVVMANTNPNDVWVVKNWPTPILWTTDIGNYIYPGKGFLQTPEDNPARIIYKVNGAEGGRQGWDPTAVWLAVRGPGDVYDVATGGYWRVNVPPARYGTWVNGPVTNQGMATIKMPSNQVLKLFDAELARVPAAAKVRR